MNSYLIELIRNDALPQRNCMLTVFDPNGDSGFLYFKDAQLIEVNVGKVWGIKALEQIFSWQISTYTVGELPVGIKRTLWEPLDKLIEPFAGTGAAAGLMEVVRQLPDETGGPASVPEPRQADPMGALVQKLCVQPGFLAVYREEKDGIRLLAGNSTVPALSPDWFADYFKKLEGLGESLGGGLLSEWYLELDQCRIWRFPTYTEPLIIFSDMEAVPEDFEDGCRAVLTGNVS
ncbi:MAG: hypothetical protein PHD76_14355 [Methylacidiphilales bacterium]|nr:hypothetical protein [Candidatus Methylacidiphilales bacterium]